LKERFTAMRYQYVIFVCRCDYMGSKFVVYLYYL
jgi:hypothetical protein